MTPRTSIAKIARKRWILHTLLGTGVILLPLAALRAGGGSLGGVLSLAAGRWTVGGIGAKIASDRAAAAPIEARLDPRPGFLAASAEHH